MACYFAWLTHLIFFKQDCTFVVLVDNIIFDLLYFFFSAWPSPQIMSHYVAYSNYQPFLFF